MSGDVQGNTSRVISNQAGADINTDGNDTKILVEDGAEKQTDDADEIKTISNAAYKALTAEEQKEYVRYNPSVQSMAYTEYLALQNKLVAGFNQLGPAIEKMDVLSNISYMSAIANNLSSIASAVAAVPEAISGLSSALSAVGLGKMVSIITSLAQGIGALCGMVYGNMMNPYNAIKAYREAFDNLDFSSLKELFESTEGTPSIAEQLAIKQSQMNEIVIPSDAMKSKVAQQQAVITEQLNTIQDAYNSIQAVESLLATVDEVDRLITIASSIMSFSVAGAAKEAYNQQYDASFKKNKQDYTEKAANFVDKINKFNDKMPIEWIKISDLEKLKEMASNQDAEGGVVFPTVVIRDIIALPPTIDGQGNKQIKYVKNEDDGQQVPVKLETYQGNTDTLLRTEYYKKEGDEYILVTDEAASDKQHNLSELYSHKTAEFEILLGYVKRYNELLVEPVTPERTIAQIRADMLATKNNAISKKNALVVWANSDGKPVWYNNDNTILTNIMSNFDRERNS